MTIKEKILTYQNAVKRWRRKNRISSRVRKKLVVISNHVHASNEHLLSVVNKIYLASYAFSAAIFINSAPYVFVSSCEFSASARELQSISIIVFKCYFYGHLLILSIYFTPMLLNAITPMLAALLPVRWALCLLNKIKFDLNDILLKTITPLFSCISLGFWLYASATFLQVYFDNTSTKSMSISINKYKNECEKINLEK